MFYFAIIFMYAYKFGIRRLNTKGKTLMEFTRYLARSLGQISRLTYPRAGVDRLRCYRRLTIIVGTVFTSNDTSTQLQYCAFY